MNNLKSLVLQIAGWVLVAIGVAALVLPGPGLLALFAGLTLLATRYEWAERRLKPVRTAALKTARDSVSSWQHIAVSFIGIGLLFVAGVLWITQPAVPSWWPADAQTWLTDGRGTGVTLIGSSIIAGVMFVYSWVKFRPRS